MVDLVSSANPSTTAIPVTFTARIIPIAPGAGVPAGTVIFSDGSTTLGSAPVVNGSASFTTSSLQAGSHNIVATFSGDANSRGSAGTLQEQVETAQYASVTVLTSSNSFPALGQPVTFTAIVKQRARISGTPTGLVTFMAGTMPLGTVALRNGKAKFMTSTLPFGQTAVHAVYGGEQNLSPSISRPCTRCRHQPHQDQSDLIRESVAGRKRRRLSRDRRFRRKRKGVSPGTVSFLDGSTALGTVTLTGGKAFFSTYRLASGTHRIEAIYNGVRLRIEFITPLKQTVKQAKVPSVKVLKLILSSGFAHF